MTDMLADVKACNLEIERLNKTILSLMNRAERSTNAQGSDFGLFQTTIMLEEQVRRRTEALEEALSENEKINRALSESEAKFRRIVNQPLVGIAIIQNGLFSYTNDKFGDIFGYSADELRKLSPIDFATESDRPLVAEQTRRRLSGEVDQVDYVFRARRKDGSVVDVEIHSGVMETDGKRVLISMALDVTERTRAEHEIQVLQKQLRNQSTHDAMTGLYNRRYLEESLDRELIRAKREGHCVSLVMADLDHFKVVNDRYGHLAGDAVLRAFSALMMKHSRGSDINCRYGGEEFLMILPSMDEETALKRAEQLREAIAEMPVKYRAIDIPITASFGVAVFPQHGQNGDELIGSADKALYVAKKSGRNQVKTYSSSIADGDMHGALCASRS